MNLASPTCWFTIENDGPNGLRLILEPEGSVFVLEPGEQVQVQLFGSAAPVTLKQSTDADGKTVVSFWQEQGTYELLVRGKRVWDLI